MVEPQQEKMRISRLIYVPISLIIMLFISCKETPSSSPADTIYINGHVVTMDTKFPEVEGFAIGQGIILATGISEEIASSYPEADVVDLERKTVMPGIIESHGHLLSLGQGFLELNVEGIVTPQEVALKVKERVENTSAGEWITGWDWDEGAWAKNFPFNEELNSDFPGETLDPFIGMYAAMTRKTPEGVPESGWYPEQCLSRDEVLKAYTIEAAYSGFEESLKGKIVPGTLADFIVLSSDILSAPVQEFLNVKVEQTYLGGELIYERN